MASQHQSGGSSETPRNEAHRYLSTDMELAPLIRGIDDMDRIREWWNEVNRLGVEGERREQVLDRMQYLKERDQ